MILRRQDFKQYEIIVTNDNTEPLEEVCVDLHVGLSYMDAGSSTSYTFGNHHILKPGDCIVVQTKESITLPRNIFGTLCAKGSLAARGFLVPNTKVDPVFSGQLDVALFNAGKYPLHVKPGMAFCSIVFHTIIEKVTRVEPRTGIRVAEPRRHDINFLNKILQYIKNKIT